ncbi:MAG: hypothetical protein KIH69_007350 [Anaerolineae bacterium]|nr:hypothetical protein [Anaerolineae bacterium]
MEIIPQLIKANSYVIYAVLAVAAVYFAFTALAALREWQRSHFRLVRSSARSRVFSAIFRMIVCGLLGAGVFFVGSLASAPTETTGRPTAAATGTFVQPTSLPTARFTPTVVFPTAVIGNATPPVRTLVTQTTSSGSVIVSIITTTLVPPTTEVFPSPTVNTTVAALPTAPPPPPPVVPTVPLVNCANPRAQIFSVTNEAGPRIFAVRGNAQVEPSGYFKVEMLVSAQSQWSFLVRSTDSVTAGVLLNNYNFGSLPPGNYPLRLVLVRGDGNISAVCETTLTLS